jgi:class 3 adenylate cyclase
MEEQGSIRRRLTAILAADAVGYSRHMSVDEEGTLRQLAAHRAVIDRIIAAHEGRIVGTAGDSVLAEFASPVEAVRCAVEIQEGVHTRNDTLPEAQRLEFRIGVNLGDVMIDGADILGDGVNVAARLEGIAQPGGICISSSVYDQIAGKLSLGFLDLGEQSLKNIARPIRVYQFDRSGAFVGARPKPPVAASRRAGWIVAVAAALAIAGGLGAWQLGLFAPRETVVSAPAPVPVPAPGASEETKMKLQIAEAERARAEAELAKTRSDADVARQRAEADIAKQRALSRTAPVERKDAMTAATPSPSPSVATNAVGNPPPGVAPAVVAAAPTVATPAPVSSPASTPPAATTAGAPPAVAGLLPASALGSATRECERFEELRAFTERQIPVRVEGGEIVVEGGVKGQPGYLNVHGRQAKDGTLTLIGTAIASSKRNFGREINVFFSGAYADGAYALTGRTGSRACTLTIRLDGRS